jgi:multimeric flavodoxin WrbA
MKVLLINGSPRENGNTARALKEVADEPWQPMHFIR